MKWYWRTENDVEVQRQCRREYRTEPPTRLTIAGICDKFETRGTVCDVHKGLSGKPRTSASPASSAMVLERLEHSPQKSRKKCARQTGINRTTVRRIIKTAKLQVFIPKLLHALIKMTLIGVVSEHGARR